MESEAGGLSIYLPKFIFPIYRSVDSENPPKTAILRFSHSPKKKYTGTFSEVHVHF